MESHRRAGIWLAEFSILIALFLVLAPQTGRALECTELDVEPSAEQADFVFEGVLFSAVDAEPALTECPRRRLVFEVGDVWKEPAVGPEGRSSTPATATFVGGPHCFGCGALVGRDYIVYADSNGELIRLRQSNAINGRAWKERLRLGEPIRDASKADSGQALGVDSSIPSSAEEETGARRLECDRLDPTTAHTQASFVFTGFASGFRSDPEAMSGGPGECRPSSIRFKVTQMWKGTPDKEIEVQHGENCLGCMLGTGRVLVYAALDSQGQLRLLRARRLQSRFKDPEFLALGEAEHQNVQDPIMDTPLGPLILVVRIILFGWGGQGGLLSD